MAEPTTRAGDVVGHGGDEEGPGLPPGVRLVALVLLAGAVALLLSRSGLLSADGAPEDARPGPAGRSGPAVVALVDDHLVRLGPDDWGDGPRLPDFVPGTPLHTVYSAAGVPTVVWVSGHRLFAVDPRGSEEAQVLGRAQRVLGASETAGRAVVLRGDRVLEADVTTGRVTDSGPFPGFDHAAGWNALGLARVLGTPAVIMARPVAVASGDAAPQDLALAWPAGRVPASLDDPVLDLGRSGRLIGVVEDRLLTTVAPCVVPDCRLQVVSILRDAVLVRPVAPPQGWVFAGTELAGASRQGLVVVQREEDEQALALARLVPGADNALLVRGTAGVDGQAGAVDGPGGSVHVVVRAQGRPEELRVWRPAKPARAERVRGSYDLPQTSRLVCVCG